jgi:HAD superfamily hydrolase (TIGR01509 family)
MAAVLFDVDGTLVDTTFLHTVCWWQALVEAGHRVPSTEIRGAIGMGSDQLLPHLLGAEVDPDHGHALSARHDALFRPYWDLLQPTNAAAELLRACAGQGLAVVLASSAKQEELRALRRAINADDAIAEATTADDVSTTKPAPDLIHRALELAGASAGDAVLVGDTVWDVAAAHRAGVVCLALTCGGTTAEELRTAGADEVYQDPADLLTQLRRTPLARLT